MAQLMWFRNDLRLADNPALTAAWQTREPVRAIFTVTPSQWRRHDWSPARVQLMLDQLDHLGRELAALGIPLDLLHTDDFGASVDTVADDCRRQGIRGLHFNDEYGVKHLAE